MRHGKHKYLLGRKKEHRKALMANLASAFFTHGKITTTLAKAKALRPFAEKIITLAKHANVASDQAVKLHLRRLAISRVRDTNAIGRLFDEKVNEFLNRNGGYTRIYKLLPRRGDDAKMAIIEQVNAADRGYKKQSSRRRKRSSTDKFSEKKEGTEALAGTPKEDEIKNTVDDDTDVATAMQTNS
ncbi:MAG: 50S ribosomal protein L17 [Puniceicoccales bacterium]|jgi:large subunit ribosomal protein L17|nr:50S ribosomal protein L17 [Puniceicoccales bacterium]